MLIGVSGELDANTAPQLEERMETLLDAGETQLIIDCSQLRYVSSAGLRVFLFTAKKIRGADGRLGVAGMQQLVRNVFVMAGFEDKFSFFESPADAVQGLS